MTRDDFKAFVENTLEGVIQFAEKKTGKTLSRKIAFRWFFQKSEPITVDIAEHITDRVFIDENNIYPVVDIGVGDVLDDETVVIFANVAGYSPRPFGKNWSGREGPFVYIIGQLALDKLKNK